jgi:hypothetical protein
MVSRASIHIPFEKEKISFRGTRGVNGRCPSGSGKPPGLALYSFITLLYQVWQQIFS